MNLKKIEKIAADLEQALGLDEAGNELIDKAEEAVANGEESLPETIDKNIEQEKKEEALPESPLEASEENAKEIIADLPQEEVEDAQQLKKDIEELDQQPNESDAGEAPAEDAVAQEAPAEAPAEVEKEEVVANDENDEIDAEGAKACIASMQKLLKIAKAVKMSKDMPACKKQEVLSKIQKASEKLRKAAGEEGDDDATERMTNTNSRQKTREDTVTKFIALLNQKRGKLAPLFNAKGRQTLVALLGNNVMGINQTAGKLTPLQLLHIFQALIASL